MSLCRGVGAKWVTDKTPAIIGRFNLSPENVEKNSSANDTVTVMAKISKGMRSRLIEVDSRLVEQPLVERSVACRHK